AINILFKQYSKSSRNNFFKIFFCSRDSRGSEGAKQCRHVVAAVRLADRNRKAPTQLLGQCKLFAFSLVT
ncbi:hypothetical protein M5D96_012776, partial [Drosophila gunungcola]